jgi:hypothetical protein
MLDIVGALFAGAYLATLLSVLIWSSSRTFGWRIAATGASVAWLGGVATLTTAGALATERWGPLPPGLAPFGVLLLSLLAAWRYNGRVRAALSTLDRPTLIGLHGFRLGGVFFIVLGLQQRLAPAFAFAAGIGDVVVGLTALIISLRLALGHRVSARSVRAWNTAGIVDLGMAVGIAILSVPGSPIGVFGVEPGMRAMTTMPWILVPAAIVPALFLTHLVIARDITATRKPDR